MKKKTEKTALMPRKEAMKMTLRGVKLLYRANPQYTVLSIINTIWSALTPYVGIYLSALIIGELAGGRDPEKLKTYVIISLASAAVIALVSAFINKGISIYGQLEWYSIDKLAVLLVCAVYAVVNSYNTHALFHEQDFGIESHFQIITPKPRHILDDQGGHFAVFDFFQKFAPTWTVEVCPGISIVHEKQWI